MIVRRSETRCDASSWESSGPRSPPVRSPSPMMRASMAARSVCRRGDRSVRRWARRRARTLRARRRDDADAAFRANGARGADSSSGNQIVPGVRA